MYFMLKGMPFIYQGQEIGMENLSFQSIAEIDDISTIDQYHVALDAGLSEKKLLPVFPDTVVTMHVHRFSGTIL